MKYQDIVAKRTYTVNGEEKVKWLNVGTLRTTDDGKQFVEINLLPDTSLYVFDQKPRDGGQKPAPQQEYIDVDKQGEGVGF